MLLAAPHERNAVGIEDTEVADQLVEATAVAGRRDHRIGLYAGTVRQHDITLVEAVAPRVTVVVGVGTVVVADVVGASLRGGGGAGSGIGTVATTGAVPNVDLGAGYPSLWSWAFGLTVTKLPLPTLASQVSCWH